MSTGLLLANGRILQDQSNFTFCSHMGLSTLDYLLLNLQDFNTLNSFKSHCLMNTLTHTPLMFSLICRTLVDGNNIHEENNEIKIRSKPENNPTIRKLVLRK